MLRNLVGQVGRRIGPKTSLRQHVVKRGLAVKSKVKPNAMAEATAVRADDTRVVIPSLAAEEIFLKAPQLKMDVVEGDNLTSAHVGQLLLLPNRLDRALSIYRLPHALNREFTQFNRKALMVRQHIADISRAILGADKSVPKRMLFLDGQRGAGKSATMLMVAANLAERKDTFVLYVPNVTSWLNGGHPFALNAVTGLYDQPEATQELLNFHQHFHQSSVLNAMKLGTKHRLPDGTTLDAGTSFANLLQSGIKSKGNATAAFAALLDELAACRSHRVVVALDMVNGLYADTAYHDTESQRLNATQFTLMRELATFAEGKRSLANGTVLASLSTWVFGKRVSDAQETVESACPSWDASVNVPLYTPAESAALLRYYAQCRLISHDAPSDPAFVHKAHFLCGGRGSDLLEVTASMGLV